MVHNGAHQTSNQQNRMLTKDKRVSHVRFGKLVNSAKFRIQSNMAMKGRVSTEIKQANNAILPFSCTKMHRFPSNPWTKAHLERCSALRIG